MVLVQTAADCICNKHVNTERSRIDSEKTNDVVVSACCFRVFRTSCCVAVECLHNSVRQVRRFDTQLHTTQIIINTFTIATQYANLYSQRRRKSTQHVNTYKNNTRHKHQRPNDIRLLCVWSYQNECLDRNDASATGFCGRRVGDTARSPSIAGDCRFMLFFVVSRC